MLPADVDPELRQLLADLNAAGFETFSSCQGKRSAEDFAAGRHCDHAFVSFDCLPRGTARKAAHLGLAVYNGNISICPDYEDERPETYIRHNIEFPNRLRQLLLS